MIVARVIIFILGFLFGVSCIGICYICTLNDFTKSVSTQEPITKHPKAQHKKLKKVKGHQIKSVDESAEHDIELERKILASKPVPRKEDSDQVTKELCLFIEYLDNNNIKYNVKEDTYQDHERLEVRKIQTVNLKYNDIEWDIRHGFGTLGGWTHDRLDRGLLQAESRGKTIGYLTANDVVDLIFFNKPMHDN